MTGASFAQYFPSAPRAARDRAMERERSKFKPADSTASNLSTSRQIESSVAMNHDAVLAPVLAQSSHSFSSPISATLRVNNQLANTNTSHWDPESTMMGQFQLSPSSTLRNPHTSAPAVPLSHMAQLTPPTSDESPAHSISASRPKADRFYDQMVISSDQPPDNTLPTPGASAERLLDRNPSRKLKVQKCVYDPSLDPSLPPAMRRKAKARYKDYSLVRRYSRLAMKYNWHNISSTEGGASSNG